MDDADRARIRAGLVAFTERFKTWPRDRQVEYLRSIGGLEDDEVTDEELDRARADEAMRVLKERHPQHWPKNHDVGIIAARLAREGWAPVNPLVLEARKIVAGFCTAPAGYLKGDFDGSSAMEISMAGLRRGIEIGRGEK